MEMSQNGRLQSPKFFGYLRTKTRPTDRSTQSAADRSGQGNLHAVVSVCEAKAKVLDQSQEKAEYRRDDFVKVTS